MKLQNDRPILCILAVIGLVVIVLSAMAMSFGWFGYGQVGLSSQPLSMIISSADTPSAQQTDKVNINTATQLQLEALPGIGEVIAGRIIDYRTQYGDFSKPEELLNIKGIGEKTLEKLSPHIVIE